MSTTLTLGGVVFTGFEIPNSIRGGGSQMRNVHKLIGGGRIIDSMGADDKPLEWNGRFRGSNAVERCRLLDYMRRTGNQVLLSWGAFRYQVVIADFDFDYQQSNEIPYRICCEVVQDETLALLALAVGFIESVAGDLVNALGLGDEISSADIASAVTTIGSAVSNLQAGVPSSTNLIAVATSNFEGPLLNSLQGAVSSAQTSIAAEFSSQETAFTASSMPAAGSDAAAITAALNSQAATMGQMSGLSDLSGVVGRMATNVSSKIGNISNFLSASL